MAKERRSVHFQEFLKDEDADDGGPSRVTKGGTVADQRDMARMGKTQEMQANTAVLTLDDCANADFR